MNTSDRIKEEYKVLKNEEISINNQLKSLDDQKQKLNERLQKIQLGIFKKGIFVCYITEIFRIAKIQFPRLRKSRIEELTPEETQELDKWIGRVKSEQGLKDILEAIKELDKYQPHQVRQNVFALCQKIIIGGAYKNKLKKV
jgi:chaperonin cofactor prefoldin